MTHIILNIFFRWLHVVCAAAFIGGLFFFRLILPFGLKAIADEELRQTVFLRCRKVFKMTVHTMVLLLIVSGTYNTIQNWSVYKTNPAEMHSLWGNHLLLALIAIGIALYALAGKAAPKHGRLLMATNLVVLLMAVAAASTLKWAREKAMRAMAAPATPATVDQPAAK
jgi:uncharacterized membrane protein